MNVDGTYTGMDMYRWHNNFVADPTKPTEGVNGLDLANRRQHGELRNGGKDNWRSIRPHAIAKENPKRHLKTFTGFPDGRPRRLNPLFERTVLLTQALC